jgi:hypothetical protein
MPSLPNAERAQVDRRKLTDYLLSAAHPIGRGKARFFAGLGFASSDAELMEAALRAVAESGEAVATEDTEFGRKYVVDGLLKGPKESAAIRTIWIVERNSETPRFVTAYPWSGV